MCGTKPSKHKFSLISKLSGKMLKVLMVLAVFSVVSDGRTLFYRTPHRSAVWYLRQNPNRYFNPTSSDCRWYKYPRFRHSHSYLWYLVCKNSSTASTAFSTPDGGSSSTTNTIRTTTTSVSLDESTTTYNSESTTVQDTTTSTGTIITNDFTLTDISTVTVSPTIVSTINTESESVGTTFPTTTLHFETVSGDFSTGVVTVEEDESGSGSGDDDEDVQSSMSTETMEESSGHHTTQFYTSTPLFDTSGSGDDAETAEGSGNGFSTTKSYFGTTLIESSGSGSGSGYGDSGSGYNDLDVDVDVDPDESKDFSFVEADLESRTINVETLKRMAFDINSVATTTGTTLKSTDEDLEFEVDESGSTMEGSSTSRTSSTDEETSKNLTIDGIIPPAIESSNLANINDDYYIIIDDISDYYDQEEEGGF